MIHQIFKKNLVDLTREERSELAFILLESLRKDSDESFSEQQWSDELKARIDHYHQNPESAKTWEEVREEVRRLVS